MDEGEVGEFNEAPERGTAARLGIVLLNLVALGLGLIRLNRIKVGLGVMFASFGLISGLAVTLASVPTLSRSAYLTGFAVLAVLQVGFLVWSMIATWRASRLTTPRDGLLWRWFSIIGFAAIAMIAGDFLLTAIKGSYRTFIIPSVSMEPTLVPGDRFVAHMRDFDPLQRGDLVIVQAGKTEYVKRVAGIPGDRLKLASGVVVINGEHVGRRHVGTYRSHGQYSQEGTLLTERFPGEAADHQVVDTSMNLLDNFEEVSLPAQTYFLLGDNRDNSADSRLPETEMGGLGPVRRERIVGKVLFKLW